MKTISSIRSLRTVFASLILLTMGISFSGCCSRNWYKNGEQDDVYATVRPADCDAYVAVKNDDDQYIQYQETYTTTYEPTYTPTIYTPPTVIYVPPPVYIPRPVPVFIPRQNPPPVYNESNNNWGNTGNNGVNTNPKGSWTSTANPNGVNTGTYNTTNGYYNNGYYNNGYNNNGYYNNGYYNNGYYGNNYNNGYYNNGAYYYYPRIPKQQVNTPKDNTRNGGAVIVTPNTNNLAVGQGGNDAGTGGSSIYNAEVKERVRVQESRNRSTIYNNTRSNSNTNTSRQGNSNSSTNSSRSTYQHTPSSSGGTRGTSTPRSGEGRSRTPR